MKAKRLLLMGSVVIVCLMASPLLLLAEKAKDEAPKFFYIESPFYQGKRLEPPVELTHLKHVEDHGLSCVDCHHEYKEGEPVQKCSECHKAEKTDEVGVTMKEALHANCRGCHRELAKSNPETSAPYTCSSCHSQIDYYNFSSPQGNRLYPAVTFTHLNHYAEYKLACTTCHHRYENGQNVWKQGDEVQRCNECHKTEDQNGVVNLKTAFHKQCETCHKTLAQSGKPAPVTCNDCHKKLLSFKKVAAPEKPAEETKAHK